MGRVIDPGEIWLQTSSIIKNLEEDNRKLQETLPVIQSFESDETLQGESWRGLKAQLAEHNFIIQALITANDSLIEDNQALYSMCGNERLDEDEIEEQIEALEQTMDTFEEMLENYRDLSRNPILALTLGDYLTIQMNGCEDIIDNTQELIREAREKIREIDEYEEKTSGLFKEADTLYQFAEKAISGQGLNWSGNGYVPPQKRVQAGSVNGIDEAVREDIKKVIQESSDGKMKERISEINQKEAYSYERWEKATMEERKQILGSYLLELKGVYDVPIEENIEYFTEIPDENGNVRVGSYRRSENRIRMNEYMLKETKNYSLEKVYEESLDKISHEMRHAYQYYSIEYPERYIVPKVKMEEWDRNFKNYMTVKKDGMVSYKKQPVESDAREFEMIKKGSGAQ